MTDSMRNPSIRVLHQDPFFKPLADGRGPGALKHVVDVLGAEVSQINNAFLVQATGNDGPVGQHPNVGGQSVAKAPGGPDRLVGVGPLKSGVEMQRRPAFQWNAFLPSDIRHITKIDAQPPLDFPDQTTVPFQRPGRSVVPEAVIDVKIGAFPPGPLREVKNPLKVVRVVLFGKIVRKTLKRKIDLF